MDPLRGDTIKQVPRYLTYLGHFIQLVGLDIPVFCWGQNSEY